MGLTVSVVIGSTAPASCLDACLEALEPQLDDGVEVLAYQSTGDATGLRRRFPWARITEHPERLVPLHWRDGIDAATGDVVALTIAQMQPAPDWIATIRRLHADHDAVGGAIEPGSGLRPSDWAELFCRYAPDLRPFPAGPRHEIPGDDAAYKRTLLESVRETYRDGFWEPVTHRPLRERGVELWHDPDLVVRMGRSAGFRAFARQRAEHGRKHGRQRGAHFSRARNLAGVAGAPLVPWLMTLRVLRHVLRRRRLRARVLAALPLIVAYNVVWALAEARGHLDVIRR